MASDDPVVTCPECGEEIPVGEGLRSHLEKEMHGELSKSIREEMDNSDQITPATSKSTSTNSNVPSTNNSPENNQDSPLDNEQTSIRPSKLDQ